VEARVSAVEDGDIDLRLMKPIRSQSNRRQTGFSLGASIQQFAAKAAPTGGSVWVVLLAP
jgi:hypothetical protein